MNVLYTFSRIFDITLRKLNTRAQTKQTNEQYRIILVRMTVLFGDSLFT